MCQFANGTDAAQDVVQFVEDLVQRLRHVDDVAAYQRGGSLYMARAESLGHRHRLRDPVLRCCFCRGKQPVRNPRHGRNHHNGLQTGIAPALHDGNGSLDRCRILDRGAAKLHHDDRCAGKGQVDVVLTCRIAHVSPTRRAQVKSDYMPHPVRKA